MYVPVLNKPWSVTLATVRDCTSSNLSDDSVAFQILFKTVTVGTEVNGRQGLGTALSVKQ